jgi:hypothetical protein
VFQILQEYQTKRADFVLKAMESPKYLEEVTGLSELHKNTDIEDVDWDEEDSDF